MGLAVRGVAWISGTCMGVSFVAALLAGDVAAAVWIVNAALWMSRALSLERGGRP